jgi:hypothetical protein
MIDKSRFSFQDVMKEVKNFNEEALGLGPRDLPMICTSNATLETFLMSSIAAEANVLPDFAASEKGEATRRASFWKSVNKKKFCDLDIEAVLNQSQWQHFFSNFTL